MGTGGDSVDGPQNRRREPEMTTVVVPLDGSRFSERALPIAGWLAARLRAGVEVVSAVATEDDRPEREQYLAEVLEAAFSGPAVDVTVKWSVMVDRDPAGVIHEALRRANDGVGCMATHGRGASAALIGSVATEVIARGHDALVLVGPMVGEERHGAGVVACVDERTESADLLRWAAQWGWRLQEPVVAVAEAVPPPVGEAPVHRMFGPDGDVESYLESLIELVRPDVGAIPVTGRVVWDPVSPSEGVIGYVEDNPAALVVVGARVHKPIGHAVVGRTSAAIVHGCPSPVLMVPRDRGRR
jgi:nucleotide-binding universal stress UspA family protein